MANVLVPVARNFAGKKVPCTFAAVADGVQIPLTGDPPVFAIPAGVSRLTVTARPAKPTYWDHSVELKLAASGAPGLVNPTPPLQARIKVKSAVHGSTRVTVLTFSLSRFREVTSDVLALLQSPPTVRLGKPADELGLMQFVYGDWPPPDWKLRPHAKAHYLDLANPVSNDALNFRTDPGLKVEGDNVVLKLAGVKAPQWFAVVWPKSIAPREGSPPSPVLLFIRQGAAQNTNSGIFTGDRLAPYPDNFDYAETCLYQNLHYSASSPIGGKWGPKGVPYQVAKSGTKAVTVIPCNAVGPEFGVIADMEQTGQILLEMQAFMFWRAGIQTLPATLGRTAIAAFSSGNNFLKKWLMDSKNRQGRFLSEIVQALYFLDPPKNQIEPCVTWAMKWAAGDASDKRIRLYTQSLTRWHDVLLGAKPPAAPTIANSPDGLRTVGIFNTGAWTRTAKRAGVAHDVDWQEAHHVIPATMLVHALSHGDI